MVADGKMFHEKTWSQKSRDSAPLKEVTNPIWFKMTPLSDFVYRYEYPKINTVLYYIVILVF